MHSFSISAWTCTCRECHSAYSRSGGELNAFFAVAISSNHALWTCCMRHAAWILNRFNPHQGLTAFEVVYGKPYHGQVCEFAEPVLGVFRNFFERQPKMVAHVVHRKGWRSRQFPPLCWNNVGSCAVSAQNQDQLGELHGILQAV